MWLKRTLRDRKPTLEHLGSLETEVMERIWARGEISVRDLHDELAGRLAYTTVMTTLDRLYKKGLLQRRKEGKAYFYKPLFSEQEYQERLTNHLFGMVLQESSNTHVVLSRFIDAVSQADQKMLDELEALVKEKRRRLGRSE